MELQRVSHLVYVGYTSVHCNINFGDQQHREAKLFNSVDHPRLEILANFNRRVADLNSVLLAQIATHR